MRPPLISTTAFCSVPPRPSSTRAARTVTVPGGCCATTVCPPKDGHTAISVMVSSVSRRRMQILPSERDPPAEPEQAPHHDGRGTAERWAERLHGVGHRVVVEHVEEIKRGLETGSAGLE